jgi:isopenicillin-N N-acyltransferase-like protein
MTAAFPLIELAGPPHERGLAYGAQAADRIALGMQVYADLFALPDLEARAHRYFAALEAYDRGFADEMRGIAEGAGQPLEAIVALNARTELGGWDSTAARSDECTAALAMPERTGGALLHGQNWDWRPACVGTSVVLRIRGEDGPDILTLCEAGQLARHGLNSDGIALTANGLQTADEGRQEGVCSPFIRRRILESRSLAGAIGVLLGSPRSASHNIMLSHSGGPHASEAVNLETTPRNAYWSFPESGLLTHGNHFKSPLALAAVEDIGLLRHPESLLRDKRTRDHLDRDGCAVTLDSFKRAFADRYGAPDAVCRSPARRTDGSLSATVASLIMDASAGRMWVAPAPYLDGADYTEYRLHG